MNSSPTHPDMDTLGNDRPNSSTTNKLYSSNPYWKRPPKSTAETSPTTTPSAKPMKTEPDDVSLPPHLIAALSAVIDKAAQAQGEQLIRQLTDGLPQLSSSLAPVIEQHLDRLVPKVVKVEQPGAALIRLVRYLSGVIIFAGLLGSGLLFAWLQTRKQRDVYAGGYWKHRYLLSQTIVSRSTPVQRLLQRADTLYQSPLFSQELQRLENIVEARQQQYQLHLREQQLINSP